MAESSTAAAETMLHQPDVEETDAEAERINAQVDDLVIKADEVIAKPFDFYPLNLEEKFVELPAVIDFLAPILVCF